MDNRQEARRREAPTRAPAPRWVKAFGAVGLLLAGAVVVLHLTGHGMDGHMHRAVGAMH